jgi:hypothetical protein
MKQIELLSDSESLKSISSSENQTPAFKPSTAVQSFRERLMLKYGNMVPNKINAVPFNTGLS